MPHRLICHLLSHLLGHLLYPLGRAALPLGQAALQRVIDERFEARVKVWCPLFSRGLWHVSHVQCACGVLTVRVVCARSVREYKQCRCSV